MVTEVLVGCALAVVIFVLLFAVALMFFGEIVVALFKTAGILIGAVFGPSKPRPLTPTSAPVRPLPPNFGNRMPVPAFPPALTPMMDVARSAQSCSFPRCKAANPVEARFCHRCGRQLQKPATMVRGTVAV